MSVLLVYTLLCLAAAAGVATGTAKPYRVGDIGGVGRRFDGFGGLSGGGATSRLLVSYPEPQRSQILDLLFKPLFGASLHILKVEIGGDAQSTDGSESSHMHSAGDENYERGYEWWLMTEAKKRNPDIKLYALSWAYPAWVGGGANSPYAHPDKTAGYIVKWIMGAKEHYNLTMDYIGIWNERNYNATYIKTLRAALNAAGLEHVEIVAADSNFAGISKDILKDPELAKAVSIIGAHYPGTVSSSDAVATGKPLWASEDYSTFNDDVGAGCWARILNQNYVNGNMTSTISWNLIASYYAGLPFFRDGLMTAIEPWSGHYETMGPVWITAHTTQFSSPGYHYLRRGLGAGHLVAGGSYVTLLSQDSSDFSIVMETMSHDHSKCIRPSLPGYNVSRQTASFQLEGSLAKVTSLNQWVSQLSFTSASASQYFMKKDLIKVVGGRFSVELPVDAVVTLSTLTGQEQGSFSGVPASKPFPVPLKDNFDGYELYSEADYFADQSGVFEIRQGARGKAMQQVVPVRPITWCSDSDHPITILGNISWSDANVAVSVMLREEVTSAFLAARVDRGGCSIAGAQGVYLWISTDGSWSITSDLAHKKSLASGKKEFKIDTFYELELQLQSGKVTALVDGAAVASEVSAPAGTGYVGFGTGGFYAADFDDFNLKSAS